jgi:RNA polymerase sigma-70 factor (ECF subfamily)
MQDERWDATACLARVRAGDEAAACQLVERLSPLILKLVRAHLPRRTSEEDLVQTVFMRIFAKLDQFSGTVPLEHWVARVTVNTCFNQLKYERVRPELRWADLSAEQEEVLRELAASTDELPAARNYAARELVERLLECLSPEDRLIVTLVHLEEKSLADVRRITGWSPTLVKVRAFRARHKMKKHLKQLLRENRP